MNIKLRLLFIICFITFFKKVFHVYDIILKAKSCISGAARPFSRCFDCCSLTAAWLLDDSICNTGVKTIHLDTEKENDILRDYKEAMINNSLYYLISSLSHGDFTFY